MHLPSSSLKDIINYIESLQVTASEVVMILFAEQDTPDIPALVSTLNQQKTAFFGGVFPGLIHSNQRVNKGCIIKKFKSLAPPFCVSGIAASDLSEFPPHDDSIDFSKGTALVLLDGLTQNIYYYLEKLNDVLGGSCSVIGGGAGSISLKQKPCIFCKEGFVEDAAVACVIDNQVRLGVRHGWKQLAGPLIATKTRGNIIEQLNWQNAKEVYNRIIENDCGKALTNENFGSVAQGYPFGIMRENEDDIVRDPLFMTAEGTIMCIGEVPPNTVLHVLKGSKEDLLDAAQQVILDCSINTTLPIKAQNTFIVDCITRTTFLDEAFSEEMDIIRSGIQIESSDQEPFGILSLGEISSYSDGLLELFNKTIVVGAFQ